MELPRDENPLDDLQLENRLQFRFWFWFRSVSVFGFFAAYHFKDRSWARFPLANEVAF